MRNLLISTLVFLFGISLYAEQPIVKYYLKDGTVKQYNLDEISSLAIQKIQNVYVMNIHSNASSVVSYTSEKIDSIEYGKDNLNNDVFNVYSLNILHSYKISEIDSICFNTDIVNTTTIGNQVWTTRNLDVDHYRNGDPIPQVTDPTQWANLTTGAWRYYNNSDSLGKIFGKLYNWYAVNDSRGLAPAGYHVPSDGEWTTLTNYLGGKDVAGGKLKSSGTIEGGNGLWYSPNSGTNSSDFSAFPGGLCYYDGTFTDIGYSGHWWSSSESSTSYAWNRGLNYSTILLYKGEAYLYFGYSVRCVRD